jgi:UDP-N-acetylglucosamine--N-acetylmuramyl-(pentapeptide) pyrophosphoryl-undecaprenol N-acetylglucosamine transferase
MKKKFKLAIATGGTGGHIFPALALVEMLEKDGQVYLILADKRFLNFKSQFPKNLNYKIIHSSSLAGSIVSKIAGAMYILFGVLQAMRALYKEKPDLLVSFGGYPSFPTMVAAVMLKIPLLIHEPNSIIGRASKLFINFATAISISFKDTKGLNEASPEKLFHTGTPIRSKILAARKMKYPALTANGKIHILILGGSQGARIFGDVIPEAVVLLKGALKRRLFIHQQCRPEGLETLKAFYKHNKLHSEVKSFFDNIEQELGKAHLIIARSGALTVSELIAVGRPSVLVPFAAAMDNHQAFNALELEKNKAATVILEGQFTPKNLARILQNLLNKPRLLSTSADNAKAMFKDWNNSFYDLVKTCVQDQDSHGNFTK